MLISTVHKERQSIRWSAYISKILNFDVTFKKNRKSFKHFLFFVFICK